MATTHRFEFVRGTSSKFWQATARPENDGTWLAEHGRIGGHRVFGGILTQKELSKKVKEKIRKGYIQIS